MKNKISIPLVIVYLVLNIALVSASTPEINYGPNWDKSCSGSLCTASIYSYEKYWKDFNENWESIDESFSECSGSSEKYCTNDYYYRAEGNEDGTITAFLDNKNLSIKLTHINNYSLTFNPSTKEGLLAYPDIVPSYFDLQYQYLPQMLKEEIILKQPLQSISSDGIVLSFSKRGDAEFNILPAIVCDAKGICQNIRQDITSDSVTVYVPQSFLNSSNVTYPITIDPTLTLNSSAILWNGYVNNYTNSSGSKFTRTSNPSSYMMVGSITVAVPEGSNETVDSLYRADIDWNVTSIPDSSVVQSITFQTFLTSLSFGSVNVSLNISQMEGWSGSYADTNCGGNCNFYSDMNNGSLYSAGNYTTLKYLNISLNSQAARDLENSLSTDHFSLGFDGYYIDGKEVRISSRDNTNVSRRPKLIVVYGVNGTDANSAIEQGINISLSNNPFRMNQQVYLLNEFGQQYLGTFDRATVFNNQTWAFNYILPGESFTNIPSLFRILNIWENQSLSFSEITNQVSSFINATKF